MGIIKVLKRKDGATLVTGVALGFVVYIFLASVTGPLADKLTSTGVGVVDSWKVAYLAPSVKLLLELVALELLIWIYVGIHSAVSSK